MINVSYEMDTDLRAIERIQQGDEQGLVELMELHRDSVFRFCFRFVSNEADAAELAEETFVRVYQNAHRFRPKAKVVTWMFSIAGNLCRDALRKRKKHRNDISLNSPVSLSEGMELAEKVASKDRSPEENAVTNEALAAIEAAIRSLPHALKFPFIYCVLEGNSYDDCAEALGTNRKTVEMRIYRARKLLRNELAELSGKF